MRKPPRNSVAAMGFEAKFNADYAAYSVLKLTPYDRLGLLIVNGYSDSEIARIFGDRSPQAARLWRAQYKKLMNQ